MGAARVYKQTTPYPHTAVGDLDAAQSADAIYLAHLDYPVYRIDRVAHTDWEFVEVTFGPTIAIPTAPTIVASEPNTTGAIATTYEYVITAVGGTPEQESRASTSVTVSNDLTLNGNKNTITFPAKPAGVTGYVVYKKQAGGFGYIGQTSDATFVDGTPQIQPVLSDAPPQGQDPFNGYGKYPSTVTFHDQRLMLGRTRNLPNAIWGSQPASFENMDISKPAHPDDALSFALVAERVNSVEQLVSMKDLMALTEDGIFAINGGQSGDPISPSDIAPKRSNSRGSSRLNPIVLDDIVFYVPNRGTTVRALGYKFEIDGFQSNNVSVFSPHLFVTFKIVSWAYLEEPYSAIFAVRDDGALLCFTWEAEQQVWGWTKLETDGKFIEVQSISEGGYDRLYALVERVINGVTRRFHERLALPHFDDITTAAHLDCSVTQVYDPPRNVMGGLWHLEGAEVSAYYDGYVAEGLLVTDGKISLPQGYEATIITAGLPYTGEIETLPLVLNQPYQGVSLHVNRRNIEKLVLRTIDSRGLKAGITGAELEDVVQRTGGEAGLDDVMQRDYEITPPGSWEEAETITIRQDNPLPAHITGLFIQPKVSNK